MKNRPKQFLIFATICAAVGALMPVQVAVMFDVSFFEWDFINHRLTPMNKVVMALSFLCVPLALRGSHLLKYFGTLWVACVLWNNYLVGFAGINYTPIQTTLASLAMILTFGLLLTEEARQVIEDPKKRWWLVPKRLQMEVPSFVRPVTGGELFAKTFDLSTSGAFVSLGGTQNMGPRTHELESHWSEITKPGTMCTIQIQIDSMRTLNCTGEIVRQTGDEGGRYPAGIGIRFTDLSRQDQRMLHSLVGEEHPGVPKQLAA